jgi:hypothetical protein
VAVRGETKKVLYGKPHVEPQQTTTTTMTKGESRIEPVHTLRQIAQAPNFFYLCGVSGLYHSVADCCNLDEKKTKDVMK